MPTIAKYGACIIRRNMLGNATRRYLAIGIGLFTNIKAGFISFTGKIAQSAATTFGLTNSQNL